MSGGDRALLTPWTTHEEVWAEAERLVVAEGWEYARVAEHLSIPISTLQKRAAKEKWRQRRQEAISYQAQVRRLKAAVLKDATEAWAAAQDTESRLKVVQLIHAWRGLEQAFPEHRYQRPPEETDTEADPLATMTDDELLAVIQRRAGHGAP